MPKTQHHPEEDIPHSKSKIPITHGGVKKQTQKPHSHHLIPIER
jgi:hypothetical protein